MLIGYDIEMKEKKMVTPSYMQTTQGELTRFTSDGNLPKEAVSGKVVARVGNTDYIWMTVDQVLDLPEASFHAPMIKKRVDDLAEQFDLDLMEAPSIALHSGKDQDGNLVEDEFVIYEGRHRAVAAKQAAGGDQMILVRRTRGNKSAALLYAQLNGSRRTVGGLEKYNALREDGTDQRIDQAERCAAKAGYSVGGKRKMANGRFALGGTGVWHINATGVLLDALEYGENILQSTLDVLAEVTRRREERGETVRDNTWGAAKTIQAVAYLINLYENEIDLTLLTEVLVKVPPYVACPVNANSAGRNAFNIASNLYNPAVRGPGAQQRKLRLEKIALRYRGN